MQKRDKVPQPPTLKLTLLNVPGYNSVPTENFVTLDDEELRHSQEESLKVGRPAGDGPEGSSSRFSVTAVADELVPKSPTRKKVGFRVSSRGISKISFRGWMLEEELTLSKTNMDKSAYICKCCFRSTSVKIQTCKQ